MSSPTISEILKKHFTVIGGALVMSVNDLPSFIRALHKWSRERWKPHPSKDSV